MALDAFGTAFKVGDGATPEVFTAVAEVHNINGPSISRDSIEVTHHGSIGGFREYIPGLRDGGEVSIDINWNPANATHEDLYEALTSVQSGNTNYKIEFPDATEFAFSGHVTGFEASAPIDDRLTASVTIKVSGAPTLS